MNAPPVNDPVGSENHDLGYPIVIAGSVRAPLRDFLRDRGIDRFVTVCDANVLPYAETLTRGLRGCLGLVPFDLGERRKRLATVGMAVESLVALGVDRRTTVLGLGGGVASDLFGFTAAIFMRGVPYVHVATSLVAMVDAAIGGKTGVDLPAGKNLAGVFRDPVSVFAHVDALATLPYRHVREGLAEVLKHAIIEGHDLFEALETLAPHAFRRWPWESVIADAIKVKTMIVRDDRLERGEREVLNLGHTFGHAIESASGYRISHGAGVAVGLRAAGLLALSRGRFSREDHLRVLALLALLKLPMRTRETPPKIFDAMAADKKRLNGRLRFVLPNAIGDVEHGIEVPESDVRETLRRLHSPPGVDEFR